MAQIVCMQCGIIAEKRIGAMFCSPHCKNSYWNRKTPQTTEEKRKITVLHPLKTEKKATKLDSVISEIPPEEIEGIETVNNPQLEQFNWEKTICEVQYKHLTTVKTQIKCYLENFDNSTKNGFTVVGGLTGMALMEKSKDTLSTILVVGIASVAGRVFGRKFDKDIATRALVEKPILAAKLVEIENQLQKFAGILVETNKEILATPKTITRKVMQRNLAFLIYQEQLENDAEEKAQMERQKQLELEERQKEEERKKPLGKIISSGQLANLPFNALDFSGKWMSFLGQPSLDHLMIIHGQPGGGKSTFSIQLANYLAEEHGEVLYISGEEGFSKTLKDKLLNNNALSKNLFLADLHCLNEVQEHVPQGTYNFIMLDSLNNMGIDASGLQQIRKQFKGSAIIAIAQSTKDGKMRGSNEIIHDCDIEVSVSKGIATTVKNRFYKTGTEYAIFDEPEAPTKEPPVIKLPKNIIE